LPLCSIGPSLGLRSELGGGLGGRTNEAESPARDGGRGRQRAGSAQPGPGHRPGEDRRAQRHVRLRRRHLGRGVGPGRPHGDRRFRRSGARQTGRARLRRPPEQARHRRPDRSQLARCRARGCRRGRADIFGRPGRPGGHAHQAANVPELRRVIRRLHRQGLLATGKPVEHRHLHGGERHYQGAGRPRAEGLVLRHCRLHLRTRPGARRDGGDHRARRPGPGQRAAPHQQPGLLILPPGGAVLRRPGRRLRQRLGRHQGSRRRRARW
jgi:hypothetical protein